MLFHEIAVPLDEPVWDGVALLVHHRFDGNFVQILLVVVFEESIGDPKGLGILFEVALS